MYQKRLAGQIEKGVGADVLAVPKPVRLLEGMLIGSSGIRHVRRKHLVVRAFEPCVCLRGRVSSIKRHSARG